MAQETVLSGLINPQVLADAISGKLAAAIKVAPLAVIDSTLVGTPGNTITIPAFAFIGEANDLAEGVADTPAILTATSIPQTVKKAVKSVKITDESKLSGYGDPVGEAENQLVLAIAGKVDTDCHSALALGTQTYDGKAAVIGYDGIVAAVDMFQEEETEAKVMFVHPKQVTQLRLDPDFQSMDKFPVPMMISGAIGMIAGAEIVPSKKVTEKAVSAVDCYINPIVKAGALAIYLKRAVNVETDRDILAKVDLISADEHYVAAVRDQSKLVVANFKKA